MDGVSTGLGWYRGTGREDKVKLRTTGHQFRNTLARANSGHSHAGTRSKCDKHHAPARSRSRAVLWPPAAGGLSLAAGTRPTRQGAPVTEPAAAV